MRLMDTAKPGVRLTGQLCALACFLLASGCASIRLESARNNYSIGQLDKAIKELTPLPNNNTDKVLFLMERGMFNQAARNYKASTLDWIEAARMADALDLYSISGDTPSIVINDRVMPFRGAPYERILMRAFAAKSYMAMAEWEDAAVEARNIVHLLENRNGFPNDPYSRYLAGLCFEINGDSESAAFQYRQLTNITSGVTVSQNGTINTNPSDTKTGIFPSKHELVCLIGLDILRYSNPMNITPFTPYSYVEVYDGSRLLGRSYELTSVESLWAETRARLELKRGSKALLRILIKEWLIHAMEEKDPSAAAALAILLYGLEVEDFRRWETLPCRLHIARMECPRDLHACRLVFRSGNGMTIGEQIVDANISRNGYLHVSFARMPDPGLQQQNKRQDGHDLP